MTEQVTQLETKLGGASEAQKAMQAQIEAQEMARRRFAQVEQKFTRDEARVLRESGDVVIRLVGMNFASGQSVIRPEHFALLTKVKESIAMYPGCPDHHRGPYRRLRNGRDQPRTVTGHEPTLWPSTCWPIPTCRPAG